MIKIDLNNSNNKNYDKKCLDGFLPVFYEDLKSKLYFPLSYLNNTDKSYYEWKKIVREKLKHLMCFKNELNNFSPAIIEEMDKGLYISKKIAFNITTESRIPAYILVPKKQSPMPAVLLLHDHGNRFDIGKEKSVEPWGNEKRFNSSKEWVEKYYSGKYIGDELAKRGYVVLSFDAFGWGDRGEMTYENQQAFASNMFLLGKSYAGLIAYEDYKAAEFLSNLSIVDQSRISTLGFSMGAYRSWQLSAVSDNIAASASICWMTNLRGVIHKKNNITKGASSFTVIHPMLFNYLDFPDVASLSATKPALFYNCENDPLFPISSVKEAYEKMKNVWFLTNNKEKLVTKIWPYSHIFTEDMQNEYYKWLDKSL